MEKALQCDLNISHYSIGTALKCHRLGLLEGSTLAATLFVSSAQTATKFFATSHLNALVTFKKCDKLSAQTKMINFTRILNIEFSSALPEMSQMLTFLIFLSTSGI